MRRVLREQFMYNNKCRKSTVELRSVFYGIRTPVDGIRRRRRWRNRHYRLTGEPGRLRNARAPRIDGALPAVRLDGRAESRTLPLSSVERPRPGRCGVRPRYGPAGGGVRRPSGRPERFETHRIRGRRRAPGHGCGTAGFSISRGRYPGHRYVHIPSRGVIRFLRVQTRRYKSAMMIHVHPP